MLFSLFFAKFSNNLVKDQKKKLHSGYALLMKKVIDCIPSTNVYFKVQKVTVRSVTILNVSDGRTDRLIITDYRVFATNRNISCRADPNIKQNGRGLFRLSRKWFRAIICSFMVKSYTR